MLDRQRTGVMKPLELRNVLTAHLGLKFATGNFSIACAVLDHATTGFVRYCDFIDAIATELPDAITSSGHHSHNTSALLELTGYTKILEHFAARGADWLNSCSALDQKSTLTVQFPTAHTMCAHVGMYITHEQLSRIVEQVGLSKSDVHYVRLYEELVRFTAASKFQVARAAALVERLVASLMETRGEILPALQKMDLNHNGVLESSDLCRAMSDLNVRLTKADADGIVRLFDKTGDGKLEYSELARSLTRKRHEVELLLDRILHATNGTKGGLLVALEKMDQSGNGYISGKELVRGMADLNVKLSTAEGENLVKIFDTNGDGTLDYSELSRALNTRRSEVRAKCDQVLDRILLQMKEGHSGVVQTLRKLDKDGSGSLDAKELCKGMAEMNATLTKVDADLIIRALDTKSGGSTLDYEEFSRALNQRRAEIGDKLIAKQTEKKQMDNVGSTKQLDTRNSMADGVLDRMLAHNGVMPALKRADRNGNGFISSDELVKSMACLHIKLSAADAEAMVRLFDTNKDGTLDFKELGRALKKRGVEKRRGHMAGVHTISEGHRPVTAEVEVAPTEGKALASTLVRSETELGSSGVGNQGTIRGRDPSRERAEGKLREEVRSGSKPKVRAGPQPKQSPHQRTLGMSSSVLRPEQLGDSLKQRVQALTADPTRGLAGNARSVDKGKQRKSRRARSLSHERRAQDPNAKPPSLRTIVDRTVIEIGDNDKNLLSMLKRMDDNGTGFISAESARLGLRYLNATLSAAEADMLVRSFDSRSNEKVVCTLDYCEFSRFVRRRHAQLVCAGLDEFFGTLIELTDRLGWSAMQILRDFDTNHRGFLFSQELVDGLGKFGAKLTATEIELIKKRFSASVPNSVDYGSIYRALGRFRLHVRERGPLIEREPRISPSKCRALAHASPPRQNPPRPGTAGGKARNRASDRERPMTAPSNGRTAMNSHQTVPSRVAPKVRPSPSRSMLVGCPYRAFQRCS